MVSVATTADVLGNAREGNDIFTLLFDKDELTWQDIIYDLIRTEKMNPWDVDVSLLAEKFINLLKEMQKMDFRLSGKIILAAAFFLKIKSDKLLKEDIGMLDSLINGSNSENELLDMLDNMPDGIEVPVKFEKPTLIVRTPQPRKRKVSVYDLVNALEKALEVEQRKTIQRFIRVPEKMKVPKKEKDMTVVINDLYKKIQMTLDKVKVVKFSQLLPTDSKSDKITTFIPLLYLDTQRKIDLEQENSFGEIFIHLSKLKKDYVAN